MHQTLPFFNYYVCFYASFEVHCNLNQPGPRFIKLVINNKFAVGQSNVTISVAYYSYYNLLLITSIMKQDPDNDM